MPSHDVAHIRLIRPIIEISRQQQIVDRAVRHHLAEHRRSEYEAGRVRRRVPARIRSDFEKQAAIAKLFHQRVIRAVRERDIRHRHVVAVADVIAHDVRKIFRAVARRTVIESAHCLRRPTVRIGVDGEHKIRALGRRHFDRSGGGERVVNRLVNRHVRVRRNCCRSAPPIVLDIGERYIVALFIDRARQHQQTDFVNAGDRAVRFLPEPLAVFFEIPVFEMRLRERRIIIPPEQQVIECLMPREIEQLFVDIEILLAPLHPIAERGRRNEFLEKFKLFLLATIEPLELLLVDQRRVSKNIRAVTAIILRLLMTGIGTGARRPHDRTENVQRQFLVLFMKFLETSGAFGERLLFEIVFARADETAVDHRVRRDHRRAEQFMPIGFVLDPFPQSIGIAEIVSIAEQLVRRHDHFVAELFGDFDRLLLRDRARIERNVENLPRHAVVFLLRLRRLHHDRNHQHDRAEDF